MDTKIVLHTKDDGGEDNDNCYCAVVLRWSGKAWYNSGIVVRDLDPIDAVKKAVGLATYEGIWE